MKLKIILYFIILISIGTIPALAQETNPPGLKQNFEIETGGYEFTVDIVSSFEVDELEFNSDDKRITLFFKTGVTNNLAEIIIPTNLINGNFTFFLDDQEIFPSVKTNEKISFITLEFEGDGSHKLDIVGTTYLPEFSQLLPLVLAFPLIGIIIVFKLKKFRNYSLIRD